MKDKDCCETASQGTHPEARDRYLRAPRNGSGEGGKWGVKGGNSHHRAVALCSGVFLPLWTVTLHKQFSN